MMAAIKIDSPLMSRNLVEIFDIIESVSVELVEQRRAIGKLAEMLAKETGAPDTDRVGELLFGLKESADYCSRLLI